MYNEIRNHNTSPYQYDGARVDPYYSYNGGMMVTRESGFSVEDFLGQDPYDPNFYDPNVETYDPNFCDDPDGLFGIGNQKKKAERKIRKAEKKLSKGKTKAAARKLEKGTAILNKIQKGQTAQSSAIQQLADIKTAQGQIAQQSADYQQMQNPEPVMQTLSTSPMSEVGSNMGGAGAGAMAATDMGTGVESDVPTGYLAQEKALSGVTVTNPKKNHTQLLLILVVAVVVIFGIIYFAKKGKK